MSASEPAGVARVAVLGAGLIGRSWTALFLAGGRAHRAHDRGFVGVGLDAQRQ